MTILHHGDFVQMKKQREATIKASRIARQERHHRLRKGGASDDVELANQFRLLGIDYLNTPKDQLYPLVKQRMEGQRADSITVASMEFLTDNFDVHVERDDELRPVIKFPEKQKDIDRGEVKPMRLYTQLAERSGQKRSVVRQVCEALVEEIKEQLQEARFIRIPEVGRLKISYRAAKEKRKGRNPFNGKLMWFKAKPASNKLRFAPAKTLKEFVLDEIEVVEPKKKSKKLKKKKSKS